MGMVLYACCFGVELTVDNIISSYFYDQFDLDLTIAGTLGAMFGLMNIFGVFCVAMALAKDSLGGTIALMVVFSIFVQSACGTSYAVVPFISKRSVGFISGFIGAGGNLSAVMAQFLFFTKSTMSTPTGILYTGIYIICGSMCAFLYYFPMVRGGLEGSRTLRPAVPRTFASEAAATVPPALPLTSLLLPVGRDGAARALHCLRGGLIPGRVQRRRACCWPGGRRHEVRKRVQAWTRLPRWLLRASAAPKLASVRRKTASRPVKRSPSKSGAIAGVSSF